MAVYDELDTFSLDYQAISLSSKLGSGQFGEVWKGRLSQSHKEKTVAVKIVKGITTLWKQVPFITTNV